jgi:predicted permease
VQRNGPWLWAALAFLAVLAARQTAAGLIAPATGALALPAWFAALPEPAALRVALPAVLTATPLFLQFGLTVAAGVLARKAVSVVPAGALLGERLRRAINWVVLWVTLPALVFETVHGTALGVDLLQAPLAAIAGMAGTALLAWLLLVRCYGRTPATGGLVLAASAGSVSFLGIPVARALFGASDARVAVYFAVLNVPLALLSAACISRAIDGSTTKSPGTSKVGGSAAGYAWEAVRQFFSLPATWALVAAVGLHGVVLPAGAESALRVLAASVGPTVMFALGLGLRFERTMAPYRMALPAVAIKLLVSPLIVLVCARLVGFSGPHLAIVSLQGAMPTQVLSVVIAERYRLDSRLVGLTLAMNTALAFVFLPLLAGALQPLMLG